jgi:hypothetical protein
VFALDVVDGRQVELIILKMINLSLQHEDGKEVFLSGGTVVPAWLIIRCKACVDGKVLKGVGLESEKWKDFGFIIIAGEHIHGAGYIGQVTRTLKLRNLPTDDFSRGFEEDNDIIKRHDGLIQGV